MTKVEIVGGRLPETTERGVFDGFASTSKAEVDSAELKKNWDDFCSVLSELFSTPPEIEGYSVSEINISLAMSAEGKFQFIAGGSVSAEAGIEVKISRLSKET